MGLSPVMFAINTSVARTTKQTPFEIVFGQQPRLDEHAWKCIEAQMKNKYSNDKKQPDNGLVIFEEDLLADVFDAIKITNKIASESVGTHNTQVNNGSGELACSEVAEASNEKDHPIQNDEEDTHHDFDIDHEELVGGSVVDLDTDSNRSAKRLRTYIIGDVVGLKVCDMDRTNTSSTILPCNVVGHMLKMERHGTRLLPRMV
ncbi:unnamed protein product [Didymodactylos carnosus]|uniref:Uncharacterized protein n=1 Tax=Didymodactylos carnosus TaxID=1234261 RepID=A0A816BYV3_9BILA|nr:unnamed protein product [Didymodactylos carnosus]CAF4498823.1 unnamed protein product [Didymodactylos carnosus]